MFAASASLKTRGFLDTYIRFLARQFYGPALVMRQRPQATCCAAENRDAQSRVGLYRRLLMGPYLSR